MKISIIIPVFNEKNTFPKILKKIQDVSLPTISKEIIIVDDGSTDGTTEQIEKIATSGGNIIFLKNETNQGKGASIRKGMKKATGDYVIIQDADLEYDPEYIAVLVKPLVEKKTEVVYGTRLKRFPNIFAEEKTPQFLLHYFGNRFLSFLVSMLYRTWITDIETGYKILPKKFFKQIQFYATGFEIEAEITVKLLKRGYTILEVPIKTKPRGYNQGKKLQTIPDGIKAVKMILKHRFITEKAS